MKVSRTLSLVVAAATVALGFHSGGIERAAMLALVQLLPLACIWFSGDMGRYVGSNFGRVPIDRATPGCLVAFGGWLLLLVVASLCASLALSGG